METRTCPHCGHENLPRAVFCFQCGTNLDDPPVVRGIHPQRRYVEDAIRYAHEREDELEPELVKRLREAKEKLPPLLEEPRVTCLRCGTVNHALARYCMGCGASLSMPDEIDSRHPVPRASARSDMGQVRENNEDHVSLWARHGIVLAVVADGMGGAVAGEEASRLVVEAIQADFMGEARGSETMRALSEDEIREKLRLAIRRANRAIIDRASSQPELQGMGTTVTLAFIRDSRVIVAHVGDSRAYRIDGHEGWINQITDDHSFVEALLSSGHITPEQAAVHPMRNVLYRALGQVEDTEADLYSRTLTEGDWLILCSDGLTRHVKPDEIAEIVTHSATPDEAAQKLIALANERGGEDNISVVAIKMENADDVQHHQEGDAAPDKLESTEVGLYQAPEPPRFVHHDYDTVELPPRPDEPDESDERS